MDFSIRTQRSYSQQQFTTSDLTESQIITTLNFSIEDLLSKISKVTEEYQLSSSQFRHSSQKKPAKILGEHNFQLNHAQSRNIKKNYSKYYQASTIHSSSPNKQQSSLNQQNQKLSCYYPPLNVFSSSADWKISQPTIIKGAIRNQSNQQSSFQDSNFKFNRLGSLFDDSNIKEVDASTILKDNKGQGTYDRLEVSTRQVEEMTIFPEQIPNIKTQQIKQDLSLADFQIGNQIGSGKFGEVYACRHKKTGFLFALKKIFKSTIKEYRMEAQFCLQLKILYMLNHPNIIKLYGHFNDEYHIFLLMEYIQGGQLLSKLKSQEKYVARILDQMISAVDYIHERGIVHRDIKPENIVLSFQSTAKLCDFGWAGIFDQKNMKTTFCGTLDYVSPEMKDKGEYNSTVDLWSIGVLAFQLLVGYAPFKDEINAWKKKGSRRSVQWDWHINYPSEISGIGQSFMRNLLKENPGERASLKFCRNHFFIRKHKQLQSQINIQMYI